MGQGTVITITALVVLITPFSTRAAEPPGREAGIRALVKELGSDDWAARQTAEKKILEIGLAALPTVKAARTSDDPEVRQRAERLCLLLKPLAKLASSKRSERIEAAGTVCDRSGEMASGNPTAALITFRHSFQADPGLLDNSFIRNRMKKLAAELPEAEKAAYLHSDVGLYVFGRHADLCRQFPQSFLTAKLLYGAGKFKAYLERFPAGFYLPNVEYCLIAGHKSYEIPGGRTRTTRIANAGREIAAWPAFLAKYPGFEGADDANYRYARALEEKGRRLEACLRLRLRLPDGDMGFQNRDRLAFIMDAKLDGKQLEELARALAKDPTTDDKLLISNREMAHLIRYLSALKSMRTGKWAEAGRGLGAAAKISEGEITELLREINNGAMKRAKLCEVAAELSRNANGDRLYRLASFIYKKGRGAFITGLYAEAGWSDAYGRSTGPARFFLSRSRFWQAERIYRKVVKEHPDCESRPKAVYMLGCCYCHMAEHDSAFWRPRQKAHVKESIFWFRLLAKECPRHELVPAARKAAGTLATNWGIAE